MPRSWQRCWATAWAADVNLVLADGRAALHVAVQFDQVEVVALLLGKEGVDVNRVNTRGHSPMFLACQNGCAGIVTLLLSKGGIDLNQATHYANETALFIACREGNAEVVRLLLGKKSVDVQVATRWGATPLDAAIQRGHVEVAQQLILHGSTRHVLPMGAIQADMEQFASRIVSDHAALVEFRICLLSVRKVRESHTLHSFSASGCDTLSRIESFLAPCRRAARRSLSAILAYSRTRKSL
jgi:hypothetical protein